MDLAATDAVLAPRRRLGRLAATIAACALLLLVFAGCSAGAGMSSAPGGGADGAASGDDAGGAEDGDGSEADRSIVVEGWMSLTVDDVAAASADAQRIAAGAGGRVDGRDESASGDQGWSTLVLRVPAETLDGVMRELGELGDVDRMTTTSSDVTDAVRDVDARVRALEATLERLKSFQSETSTVGDLLEVEREVSDRQAELEKLRAEQASLDDRVQFSSLTVELHSEGAAAPAPDTFGDGFVAGWDALIAFTGVALVVLGAILPWLIVIGGVTVAVLWVVRALRRRAPARAPAAPTAPAEPSPAVPEPASPPRR